MITFYNYKRLHPLFLITILFISSVLIFSCETLNISGNKEADLVELYIRDIFQEDIIKSVEIHGNYNASTIYSVLQELFEESNIRFFMEYSDDNAIQDLFKEIAIIESAEKAYFFSIKKSEEILTDDETNDESNIEAAEKLFILSVAVKQLLIDCTKNIDPLIEEIEQIIEEKKWDMENEEAEDDSDLFFDIIKLENGVSYLHKTKKSFPKNIVEITKIADTAEDFLNQF